MYWCVKMLVILPIFQLNKFSSLWLGSFDFFLLQNKIKLQYEYHLVFFFRFFPRFSYDVPIQFVICSIQYRKSVRTINTIAWMCGMKKKIGIPIWSASQDARWPPRYSKQKKRRIRPKVTPINRAWKESENNSYRFRCATKENLHEISACKHITCTSYIVLTCIILHHNKCLPIQYPHFPVKWCANNLKEEKKNREKYRNGQRKVNSLLDWWRSKWLSWKRKSSPLFFISLSRPPLFRCHFFFLNQRRTSPEFESHVFFLKMLSLFTLNSMDLDKRMVHDTFYPVPHRTTSSHKHT